MIKPPKNDGANAASIANLVADPALDCCHHVSIPESWLFPYEDLDWFLLIAEELQLKGLSGNEEEPSAATKDATLKLKTFSEEPEFKETKRYKAAYRQFENSVTQV